MSNPELNPDIYKPNAIFNPSSPIHVLPKPPPFPPSPRVAHSHNSHKRVIAANTVINSLKNLAPPPPHLNERMPLQLLPPHLRGQSSKYKLLPSPDPLGKPPRPPSGQPRGTVNLNRLRNQRNNQSNNFTQRVRRSVALRHASYPGLTVKTGKNRMSLANAVATLNNKNTRQRVSMNRTLRGNFEPENVNYRKTVPHATIRIGNRGLSQNQSKVFANIFASTNDFNSMKRRINRLNRPKEFKNALHARLNYLVQQ